MRIAFCQLEMIWVEIHQKTNPNLIPKMLPLKTIIDIVIVISYMIKLHHLDFGPQVVTSNLQTLVK